MGELRVLESSRLGVVAPTTDTIAATSLGNADYFRNTGSEVMYLKHASGSATAYANIIRRIDGDLPTPKSVAVVNTERRVFGPFPVEDYGDRVDVWASGSGVQYYIVRI